MQISSLLSEDRCKAATSDSSKKRLLENLAGIFAHAIEGTNETALFQSLVSRERLGSTGIGQGIAIPHCRFATGGETLCACITLEQPIDFDAVDGEPVDLVFAMLVPENAEDAHLQTLSSLAENLQDPSYAKRLRACHNNQELFRIASGVN
ncbi:PTS sugar transporter subunit IIA [Teredinibacter franksiae]|jgi:Phosphotransferase system mannitol/fructose-specific IIA domain (Ntr-type)|uniref:PTS sugar transporter subunit IIA n=1 Tax=Teredinibacter franksiae TaxID=2761453 RepID=UPI00162521E1|nr:PTS sugar transporter subunit IIA [Teredinibacter franksiae]